MSKRQGEYDEAEHSVSPDAKKTKIDHGSDSTDFAHDDFTVGWVCALSKEQTAATAMLDHIYHDLDLQKPPSDPNAYTLGSIGKHNIVITCLPEGEIGTNSAARVVTRMISTFPSIKFGLMVGIGGGIPPKVRLGDVVVSAPISQYPGVVQWDMGKMNKDDKFERTGALNNPPTLLRTALTKLKTQHEMVGPKMPEYLKELGQKWPRLAKKYLRSDSLRDPLFDPEESEPEEVCVHYGLIASGNKVIKDAVFRDKLNEDLGGHVLCVEMEAAGLMNDFSCIVIRGICDYADAEKKKDWQEHAAAMAAAFAKEFLQYVQPSDVKAERPVKDILKVLGTVSTNVAQITKTLDTKENAEILDWLTPVDYGPKQSDFVKRRQEGTGQWLIESKEFQEWLTTSEQILFCPGIPGAGKSTLTSIVVEHLHTKFGNDQSIGIAYIYCDFKRQDEQKAEEILASLLKQLAQRRPSVPENVKALYNSHRSNRTRPLLDAISKALTSVVAIYSKVFIIIDALDECQMVDTSWSTFLSRILFDVQMNTTANFFVTSRHIHDITKEFEDNSVFLEIRAKDEDVEKYLDAHMTELRLLNDKNRDLSNERKEKFKHDIRASVIEVVNGMFLLARLHLQSLIDKTTPHDLNVALKTLPKGEGALLRAYGATIGRIRSQSNDSRYLAERVLSLLTCAERLLTTSELRDALAIRSGSSILDEDKRESTNIMVSVCAGLVTIDEDSDIVRLVHETTREFLVAHMSCIKPQKNLPTLVDPTKSNTLKNDAALVEAHRTFALICISYLSLEVFESGYCNTHPELRDRLRSNPFYDYAARNWGHHARRDGSSSQELIEFLENRPKVDASTQVLMNGRSGSFLYSHQSPGKITGLHLTGYFGLMEAANALLGLGYSPNLKDSYNRTPVWYAAHNGCDNMITFLLQAGADVNTAATDRVNGRVALQVATENGHAGALDKLLKGGASLTATRGVSLLQLAAKGAHIRVIDKLLEAGADINAVSSGRIPSTAIQSAAERGHLEVVEKLLAAGADPDVLHVQTALQAAVGGHHIVIVERLIASGAKVNAPPSGRAQMTALQMAVTTGNLKIIDKLLDAGANVNAAAAAEYGQTALQAASGRGFLNIVEKLLALGADVNAPAVTTIKTNTPLQAASAKGHLEIVVRLLEAGANVNSPGHGTTALQGAAGGGHLAVVEKLIALGAEINTSTTAYGQMTALQRAASGGFLEITDKLLVAGADVNAGHNMTALQEAARGGHMAVIERLLVAGADVNLLSTGYGEMTAVLAAAQGGHLAVITRLLAAGADVNGTTQRTALEAAAQRGDLEMFEKLLEAGADADDGGKLTALYEAIRQGHLDIVRRLFAAGADVTLATQNTSLQVAAEKGYLEVIEKAISEGVDLNTAHHMSKTTMLKSAADGGHLEIIEKLLAAGADVDAGGEYTALITAARKGNLSIVTRLLAAGADVNGTIKQSPLLEAAERDHLTVVEKLLEAGADVDAATPTESGRTALYAAVDKGYLRIVDKLLAAGADANTSFRERTALQAAIEGGYLEIANRLRAAQT